MADLPDRFEELARKQAAAKAQDDGHIEVLAADLVAGDRLWWGGELLTITGVRAVRQDHVEIFGQREGWTFPLEFLPFELVHVAVPRPANAPGPNQGVPA